jgi:hypothetical protein
VLWSVRVKAQHKTVPYIPTAATRVRSSVTSCGICCGQEGTEACFLRILRFPCQLSFHRSVSRCKLCR